MNNFIKSENIYVFPCARRLQYDVGAKLSTEENLSNIPSLAGRKSYIIKDMATGDTDINFVLGGYKVKANKEAIIEAMDSEATEIYACCKLKEIELAIIDSKTTTTLVLQNLNSEDASYLDATTDNVSYFYGIKFTSTAEEDYNLKLFTKSGDNWSLYTKNLGAIDNDQIQDHSITPVKFKQPTESHVVLADDLESSDHDLKYRKLVAADFETVDAGKVLAGDAISSSTPSFRSLAYTDIPQLGNITNEGKLSKSSYAVTTDSTGKIQPENLSVSDPTADGNAITAITTISQDSRGKITATKATIPDGSLYIRGEEDTSYKIFSANQATNATILFTAEAGNKLVKEMPNQKPEVTVINSGNTLQFNFNGIIGNGFTYKASKDACQIIGDYYIDSTTYHIWILTDTDNRTFSDAGNVRGPQGTGIESITLSKTTQNIDTYAIKLEDENTSTFNVINAVDAFGYCTWSNNTAKADYPSFKWSTNLADDNNRRISLYFNTDKVNAANSTKLNLAGKSYTITNENIKAGWYYAKFAAAGTTWTLTPVFVSREATEELNGLMSAADKTKLNNIEAGAQTNVQANWNCADNTDDSYIQNKPTIPAVKYTDATYGNSDSNTITNFSSGNAARGLKIWVQSSVPTEKMKTGDIWIKY